MNIEVKGHSGCQIDVVNEDNKVYVYKSTKDPQYLRRLVLQAEKQQAAAQWEYQHIRVPKVYEIETDASSTIVKMQYVYSKNFMEFFEQAGFEQIEYLINALEYFIDHEVDKCTMQSVPSNVFKDKFFDINSKVLSNPIFQQDKIIHSILDRSQKIFGAIGDIKLPIGVCHGDLTFSNILFNGNNYYLIDFLDSFIETPLQDIVKLRQDTAFRWSQLMYTKKYDDVRLHIILDKIDQEIDCFFRKKYQWYCNYYQVMQLMNMLRILPYAKETNIIDYLKRTIVILLDDINNIDNDKFQKKSKEYPFDCVTYSDQSCSLIVPVAADKPEYEDGLPYVFCLDHDGISLCVKSILGLDLSKFNCIFFTILHKHDVRFFISDCLKLQFKRLGINNVKVTILDLPTKNQSETVYQTIIKEEISGSFFVKDGDSFFNASIDGGNGISIYPIEEMDILEPKDKSYVAIDDMYYVTNVIEKSVVSHFISSGGYMFNSVNSFCSYYIQLRDFGSRLYMSHIIYAMLLDNNPFRPILASNFSDWGNKLMLDYNKINNFK